MPLGGSEQESVSKVELPPWAEDAAKSILGRANVISQQPYTPYPYARLAGFNPDHQAAFDLTRMLPGKFGMGGGADPAAGGASPGGGGGDMLDALTQMLNKPPVTPLDPSMPFAEAKDAFLGARDEFGDAREDFRALEGADRRAARPGFLEQREDFSDVREWYRGLDPSKMVSIEDMMEQVFGPGGSKSVTQGGSFTPPPMPSPGINPFTYGQTGGEAMFMHGSPGAMSPLAQLMAAVQAPGGPAGGGGGGMQPGTPTPTPTPPPPPWDNDDRGGGNR